MRSLFAAALVLIPHHALTAAAPPARPNVVLILADDLGWSDCGLNGKDSFHPAPNLARLAARGMTFSRAYSNSPLCSPTRASILTGQSAARHGITAPVGHLPAERLRPILPEHAGPAMRLLLPESATRLRTDHVTLAEAFARNGYATGHFGKWHLGPPPYSPLEHGFQADVPHDNGPGPRKGFVGVWDYPDLHPRHPEEHLEDRMAEEAVRFIEAHKDQPFFLNYWQFSVHAPFDAKKDLVEKHRAAAGSAVPRRSPTYAAMVETMDAAIGTLLDAIDRNGLADRTVIVFTSDNGGNMYDRIDGTTPTRNDPLRGGKATLWEGGIRVPCVIAWPGLVRPGSRSAEVIQTSDLFPTFAGSPGFTLPEGTLFDGADLHPVLTGGRLKREAVFIHFPHSPGVPDTLPPGIAVISGDWKLIRLFHDGPGRGHRHLLFHLTEDIGETRDLAKAMPERVREMDALIEDHLTRTAAIVPKPNPAHAPDPIARRFSHPATCSLSTDTGHLLLRSTGKDPWLAANVHADKGGGPFTLSFRMKSNGSGPGRVFWRETPKQAFDGKTRSIVFEPAHDGTFHDVEIRVPATSLAAIRIDPGESTGEYRFERLRLRSGDRTVFEWPPQAAGE